MSSPWSKAGSPSVTLPPPPAPAPHAAEAPAMPFPGGLPPGQPRRSRSSARAALWLLLAIVVSAVITATVTFLTMRSNAAGHSDTQPSSAPTAAAAPPPPAASSADAAAAKAHLCQVFDTSVRGQEGQGGLRVDGNLNLPVILRAVNSASAVQSALAPAVPPDIAAAAHKYVSATLDQTTAAMGNTPTAEVNRLTDARNDAINSVLDVCGLPR